jgi:FMN phosphatase YigB (HAD superfamily)
MPITLLLDLDDTLLDTNLEVFLPAYYSALAENLRDVVPPEAMLGALRAGVKRMMLSSDPACTLQQVFEDDFYARLSMPVGPLRERLMRFYVEVFPSLGAATRERSGARELLEWAASAGHRVALATDPVFPRLATMARIRWAGLDPSQFELISSFEDFHFTKTHPAYFAEILGRLGWPDQPVIMAGNDADRDVASAQKLGLTTFLVGTSSNGHGERRGDLVQLRAWIQANESNLKPPVFETPEAVISLLEATAAALQGMTAGLSQEQWKHEVSAEEWALVELVCHLRDTEREVHAQQIQTLLESPLPFVARPDAAVWAKQRRYLGEDGPLALGEFARARAVAVARLRSAAIGVWSKQARHAIFGPSTFLEVVGFMAEHDRLHLRQAWRTLQAAKHHAHRN